MILFFFYEIDQHPYQNVFYNVTVEVVESGGLLSVESVFLIALGIALLGLFGLWAYGQVQQLSKKTKKAPKVELGTGTTDANIDEWLERSKSKKKPFVSCRLASPSPASWFLSDFWVPDVSSFFFFWKRTSFGLFTFPFPHFISSPVCRRGEGGLSDLLPLAKAKQGRKLLLTRACSRSGGVVG